jgi:predicted metalloprotease with PDZ domain
MRKFLFAFIGSMAFCSQLLAQQEYQVHLDLKQVKNDRVKVSIVPPKTSEKIISYIMPEVIPGSYSRKDYGRFVNGFTAYSTTGRKLKVKRKGHNEFEIRNANELARIEYAVDDTWDDSNGNQYIFQPGGTNIEADNNFVINHFGFYGYLQGYKMLPYQLTITKPEALYGATSLPVERINATTDKFYADNYVKLADAPVLYTRPDTSSFMAGNTRVHISVYSETGAVTSAQISNYIQPLSGALSSFFGTMPVDNYHFLMFFPQISNRQIARHGGFGALEHSYSSLYFLPERSSEAELRSMVLGIAAHEFLHILTPLNIHSEEINDFDFKNPRMSRHLWLYEGVTEYFSNLVQVREGLMTYEAFIDEMQDKIKKAAEYPEVSFTEMSRLILHAPYKDMYSNVYEKGALLGFLLDIRLHELSGGQMGLREVLLKLSDTYGPDKPFKDEDLVAEITSLTYPEIGDFFKRYIEGNEALPYEDYFNKIGLSFKPQAEETILSFGQLGFKFNEKKNTFVATQSEPDYNAFGLRNNDVIVEVNGYALTMQNYEELLKPLIEVKTDREVSLHFLRDGKLEKRNGRPRAFDIIVKNKLKHNPEASSEQKALRQRMLNTPL